MTPSITSALLGQAREGFTVDLRWALLAGAVMLPLGAAHSWLRAPRTVTPSDSGLEPTAHELEE